MSLASDKVIVGKIGAPYGVKGWVKINSYTETPEGIFDYAPWFLGDEKEYQIDQWRPHGKSLVAKIVGVDSRDDAERIRLHRLSNYSEFAIIKIKGPPKRSERITLSLCPQRHSSDICRFHRQDSFCIAAGQNR